MQIVPYTSLVCCRGGGGLVYHLFVIALAHQFGVDAARVAVGEGDWSFGQTLAMLMVVQPLVEMCMECKKWYPNRKRLDNLDNQKRLDNQ
jgi:hypothetical protein